MKENSPVKITIAIPTYARTAKLQSRIAELIPQLSELDSIWIFDNASPNFEDAIFEFEHSKVNLIRGSFNLGPNANIARCFSAVSDGWIWIVSDDDPIFPDALKIIREEIIQNRDCAFINFADEEIKRSRQGRNNKCISFSEFVEKNDGFANTLLISNSVHNVKLVGPHLKFASSAVNFNCPHLAPAFMAIQAGAPMYYSPNQVVSWNKPDGTDHWNIVSVYHLLEATQLITSRGDALELEKVIARAIPSFSRFIINLCYSLVTFGPDWRARNYSIRVAKSMGRAKGLVASVSYPLIARSALLSPGATYALLSLVYKFIKKTDLANTVQKRRFQLFL